MRSDKLLGAVAVGLVLSGTASAGTTTTFHTTDIGQATGTITENYNYVLGKSHIH